MTHPPPRYLVEPLDPKRHDRAAFSSSEPALDVYLRTLARKDMERGLATCYVMREDAEHDANTLAPILGFYTLSACSVELTDLPAAVAKSSGRYTHIPGILIGHLAVSEKMQGQGKILLFSALHRIWRIHDDVGVKVAVVDALHDKASAFYERHGFQRLDQHPLRLILPIEAIKGLVSS